MPAVTTADLNTLRQFPQSTRLGMAVFRATGIVSGVVSGTPARGTTSLTLASISETRTPRKHYTVIAGSSAGASDGGKTRMKSWSSPTLVVAANNIKWVDYPYVTILEEILPWAIIPDLENDKEDGDVSYTNENLYYHPLGRIGPPAIGWTNQAVKFWSDSTAVASGASLSSHAWTFPSGSPSSSSSAGSAASPISVTWAAATGHIPHYVRYVVTDSNGKTHARYCPVWIFDSFDDSYCNWELESLSGDFDSGGWQARIRVFGDATTAEFPEDAMVVIFAEDRYAGHKTSIGGNWDHRQNIVFVGWIVRDTVMKDDEKGDVSFEIAGPTHKMKELNCWPANLEYVGGTPDSWHKLKGMTSDLAAFHIITEHTTMDHICDVVLSGVTKKLRYVDIPEADPYQQIDEYCANPIGARLLADRQGRLYISRNPNLRPTSERAGIATVVSLDINDPIRADPGLELAVEEHEYQVAQVDFVAFGYDGSEVRPYYSLAPEFQYETGRVEKVDGIRADSQSECNELAGLYLSNLNNIWREVRLPTFNWRVFDIAPQEYTLLTLAAADTRRGVTWTNQKLICRAVDIKFDAEKGQLYVNPTFERDTSGPSGVTGDYPTEPPQGPWDYPAPTPPEWPSATTPLNLMVLASGGDEIQFAPPGATAYEDRTPVGITDFLQVGWDPWWFTVSKANTFDPERAIIWACKVGAIYRSTQCGKAGTWTNVTPVEDPPNSWGDDPAPTIADVEIFLRVDNVHKNGQHVFLVRWQNAAGDWRSWLLYTNDDGQIWTWKSLAGVEVVGGTIYVAEYSGLTNQLAAPNGQITVNDSANIVGENDDVGLETVFDLVAGHEYQVGRLYVDLGGDVDGSTVKIRVRTKSVAQPSSSRMFHRANNRMMYVHDTLNMTDDAGWHAIEQNWPAQSDTFAWGTQVTVPAAAKPFRYIMLRWEPPWPYGGADGQTGYIDAIEVTGGSITPPETRALWADMDSVNGNTLWLTVWRDGTLYLQKRNTTTFALIAEYSLGSATIEEVGALTYVAYVNTGPFVSDQIYVYGRMQGPGGLSNPTHILKSDASGGFTELVSDWGADYCSSFRSEGLEAVKQLFAIRAGAGVPKFYFGMTLAYVSDTLFPAGASVLPDAMSIQCNAGTPTGTLAIGCDVPHNMLILESPNFGQDWNSAQDGLSPTGSIRTVVYV